MIKGKSCVVSCAPGIFLFRHPSAGLERKTGVVRQCALLVAALAAIALVRSSCYPDEPPDPILWAVIVFGSAPSIVLAGLILRARRKIGDSAERRRQLQVQCEAGR